MRITYKTNGRRGTVISISDIGNDILYNMKEINSFGGHLANNICIDTYKIPAQFGTGDNVVTFSIQQS